MGAAVFGAGWALEGFSRDSPRTGNHFPRLRPPSGHGLHRGHDGWNLSTRLAREVWVWQVPHCADTRASGDGCLAPTIRRNVRVIRMRRSAQPRPPHFRQPKSASIPTNCPNTPLRSGSPLVTKSNGSGKSGECESPPRLGERYEVVFADTLQNQKSRPSVAPVGDKVRTTGSNRIGLAPRESRFWGPGTLGAGIFRVSKFEFEPNHTAPRTRSVPLYPAALFSGIILQLPPGSIDSRIA